MKMQKSADPGLTPPSSSDDSAAATAALLQKIQSEVEKKEKDSQGKHLQTYQLEIRGCNMRAVREYQTYCSQLDEIFDNFTVSYAKIDDEIRAIWSKIHSAHAPFTADVEHHLISEIEGDNEREKQHVLGLAYHRKSEEAFARVISRLVEIDPE